MKTDAIVRMKDKNRPQKSKTTMENIEYETAMMCWEALNDSPKEEPRVEPETKGEKLIKKTQHQKDAEEQVEPTLNTGNWLKLSIEEFSWETEDDGSTLDTQEKEQEEVVYITNLKGGLQKDSTKLYDKEGPNNKKPAMRNRHFEEPTLNNLNHIYELYEESGSDNKNIEEIVKGENKKELKRKKLLLH